MGDTNKRVKVFLAPSGLRVSCSPMNRELVEETTKSKRFIIAYGECQRPVSERFLRENFLTIDGRTPDTERYVYDRVYKVIAVTKEALEFLSECAKSIADRTYAV